MLGWMFCFVGCVDLSNNNAATAANSKLAGRDDWRNVLHWQDDCENAFHSAQIPDYSGIEIYEFSPEDQLVMVMCAVGSYQPSFLLFRMFDHSPEPLSLETFSAPEGLSSQKVTKSEYWGETAISFDQQELSILNFSRQTRDCGTWANYSLSGKKIVLKAFRFHLPCADTPEESIKTGASKPPEGWKQMSVH